MMPASTPPDEPARPHSSEQLRVVLIDDDPMVIATLENYLAIADRIDIVATAHDGAEAVRLVTEYAPDVVVMDIRMAGVDGIAATTALVRRFPDVKVVILTTFDNDDHLLTALDAGASGFLLKSSSPQEIIAAITQAHEGNKVVSPGPTTRLIDNYLRQSVPPKRRHDVELSARETEVLALICQGKSNGQIAQTLYVGETTVKTHVSSIMRKFGVSSRLEIVVYAYEHRLVR